MQLPVPSSKNPFIVRKYVTGLPVPLITHEINKRKVAIYCVAFDGTNNDMNHLNPEERDTVVGFLAENVPGIHYYPGPGTEKNVILRKLDAAMGFTTKRISNRATKDFIDWADRQLELNPEVELRVAVFGFSRGAAIARDFMTTLSRESHTLPNKTYPLHFFALLFDTVPGINLQAISLSLPRSVDYLIHIVSLDERRFEYSAYIDTPSDGTLVPRFGDPFSPRRVNLILVPGAHADIGGGYANGIDMVYRLTAAELVYMLGVTESNCWVISGDAVSEGMHDSRGLLNRLVGDHSVADYPHEDRTFKDAPMIPLSPEEATALNLRLSELIEAQATASRGVVSQWVQTDPTVLYVQRDGGKLSIVAPYLHQLDTETVLYKRLGETHRLEGFYNNGGIFEVNIPDRAWALLEDGHVGKLEYQVIEVGGKFVLSISVNDKLLTLERGHSDRLPSNVSAVEKCAVVQR